MRKFKNRRLRANMVHLNFCAFFSKSGLKIRNSKFRFKDLMRTVPRNIPMKFHRSNMKTEEGVCKSLKSSQKPKKTNKFFQPKPGLKSKNSRFHFLDLMRTVPRNIPMKFHRSNVKTEGGVRKSLKIRSNFTSFWTKIGPKKQKSKIPLQKSNRDSVRKHSYEVYCSNMKTERGVCKSFKPGQTLQVFLQVFRPKSGLKSKKFKIPLQRSLPDIAKEHSYEETSL